MKTQSYRLSGDYIMSETAAERFVTRADAVAAAREILCGEPLSRVKITPTEDHPTCTSHEFAGYPRMIAITTIHNPADGEMVTTGTIDGARRIVVSRFDDKKGIAQNHIDAADAWIRKRLPGGMVGPMAEDATGGFIRLAYDPKFNISPVSFRPVK